MTENPLVAFKSDLRKLVDAHELALPANVKPERFQNAAIVAVQDNPQILDCDRASVFKAIRTLAAAGLVPDGREAALVPFNTREGDRYVKKCQAMPMVFGLIKMARRSGEVSDIRAHIVYQNELDSGRFEYTIGDTETLTHSPILFGEKGDPVAVYAIATLKDGTLVREFMGMEDIDRVRRAGSSQRTFNKATKKSEVSDEPVGIWKDWFDEMAKKTVIRRLCKRLDMSADDMRRLMVEPDYAHMKDVTPEPSGFAKMAQSVQTESGDQIIEPEVEEVVEISAAFRAGYESAADMNPVTACPHEDGKDRDDWIAGWNAKNEEDS